MLILPLLLGCGCCEGPAVVLDSILGGDRDTFTDQDVIGDWSSDCGGSVSIRGDGTATVKDLPIREEHVKGAVDDVEVKTGGEFTWKIFAATEDTDQEVRFQPKERGGEEFSAHAERTWGGFEHLEYYKNTPSDPVYCVLSR